MRSSPVLLVLCTVALFRMLHANSFFPCHATKASVHHDVKCKSVKLPPRLCATCPLRPTRRDGSFEQCDRIYDTTSAACLSALRVYVDDNACDTRRAEALRRLERDRADDDARSELDYFLYSVCEQCCDCIPMGVRRADFPTLAQAHSPASPALWSATRGNCPAHARYDVCKVLPSIATFSGDGAAQPVCGALHAWIDTPDAEQWQTNPRVTLAAHVQHFLNGLLAATQCDDAHIWGSCYQMESKQHHLDVPAGYADADDEAVEEGGNATPRPTPAPGGESDMPVADASASKPSATQSATQAVSGDSSSSSSSSSSLSSSGAGASSDSAAAGGNEAVEDNSGIFNSAVLNGIRSCFPASARVGRRDGRAVRMDQLRVGDEVHVGGERFSSVYAFSHRVSTVYGQFVELGWGGNGSVALTGGHRIRSNGVMKVAREVRVGDVLEAADGSDLIVQRKRTVWHWGLYNPHTLQGELVVNGVVCSTFTEAVDVRAAHGLLTPLRALFRLGVRGWLLNDLMRHGVFSR